jgi:phosphopantothenoylcysteine decarboxylase/phosphopantothenate--cysteine ligase
VIVMAAAVADFRAASPSVDKVKRTGPLTLELVPTEDIAAEARRLAPQAFHVSFAVESSDLVAAAHEKRRRKGSDLVVANAITEDHSPFGGDVNRVALVTESGARELPEMPKREVARLLLDEVAREVARRHQVQ